MAKKTLWNGANPKVTSTLNKEVPDSGKVEDKKRPALEAYRKLSNAYHEHYNNGWGNSGRAEELRKAAATVGEKTPKVAELKKAYAPAHQTYQRMKGKEAEEKLEHIARKVTLNAIKEHRAYGKGHDMGHHGEGKEFGKHKD